MYCMTKPEPKLGNINPKKKKISRTNTDNIMSLSTERKNNKKKNIPREQRLAMANLWSRED